MFGDTAFQFGYLQWTLLFGLTICSGITFWFGHLQWTLLFGLAICSGHSFFGLAICNGYCFLVWLSAVEFMFVLSGNDDVNVNGFCMCERLSN